MKWIRQETIHSSTLSLEPFTLSHITERYIQWLNDPVVVRYSEQRHITHTRETCLRYFHACSDSPHLFYAILLAEKPNEHIGNVTAYIDRYNQIADLAIVIGEKNDWGKGYGLEAWKALASYLFQSGIRKITAGTMSSNMGMLRIMEKSGMKEEGRRYQHFLCEGKEEDLVFYAMRKK